jgi:cysteine desulfurase/selenocysteine lyase
VFKDQFPFFINKPEQVYLDSAATTQKHASVVAVVNDYHLHHNATVHRSAYQIANQATALYENSRNSVAKLISAKSSAQIVFSSGATESINTIANGLHKTMLCGSKILILASEHHANLIPWQKVASRFNLQIEIVKLSADGCFTQNEFDQFSKQLTADVAILAMAHVSNALGNIYPVKEVCNTANNLQILTVIDGTQAIAHMPVNVEDIGCDFYVFSGHKMYGPTGVGVLYGKSEHLENLAPFKLGGEMITQVSYTHAEFQPAPLKFEGGTPNVAGVIGLGKACEFLLNNIVSIQQHEKECYTALLEQLEKVSGLRILGNMRDSIGVVSIVLDKHNISDLAPLLYQKHIAVRVGHHCAMPLMDFLQVAGTLRVSLACYTTMGDLDNFMRSLQLSLTVLDEGESGLDEQKVSVNELLPLAQKIKSANGWDNQYRQLLLASKSLKIMPVELRIPDNAVFGCESDLWISVQQNQLSAYSQSKIVRGILAVLIEKATELLRSEGSKNADDAAHNAAAEFDYFDYLAKLKLTPYFSAGRRDGVQNAVSAIKQKLK